MKWGQNQIYAGNTGSNRGEEYPIAQRPALTMLGDSLPSERSRPLAGDSAASLEQAASAVARLDSALGSHPLAPAWAYRARLEAVRRQAAVDGRLIDLWRLAAMIEGVRLRFGCAPALIDRGVIFDAARHAFDLYRWYSAPDDTQRATIGEAEVVLAAVADGHSPLLGAAHAVHAWLDQGGERPPLRAALARYWVVRGVTALPCPLLSGAERCRRRPRAARWRSAHARAWRRPRGVSP
jgi:hypothetical protein